MCELTFVNTHRSDLNRIDVMHQLLENTKTDNKDGWGMFTVAEGVLKTSVIPWTTKSLGSLIRHTVTEQPVLLHVRSASVGTVVKVEFNHPFETSNLVLAHNGTLKPRKENEEYKDKLDSEVFLLELDKAYLAETETTGDAKLVKILKSTMSNFTGKFAFLIYDKVTGIWYAVRGKTADLHLSYILDPKADNAILGYVINTVKDDLEKALDASVEFLHLLNRPTIPLWSEIEALKEETIYRLDTTAVEIIGEVKQNIPVYASTVLPAVGERVWSRSGYGGYGRVWGYENDDDDDDTNDVLEIAKDLTNWMNTYGMSLEELDLLMLKSLGVPMLACNKIDIETLRKHVLPKIQCSKVFRTHMMKKLKTHGHMWIREVYAKGPFQFPYMLETNRKEFLNVVGQTLRKLEKV